jgi:hypothetical protein
MSESDFKYVKFKKPKWEAILEYANKLAEERNHDSVSLPNYILEAVDFFEANRNNRTFHLAAEVLPSGSTSYTKCYCDVGIDHTDTVNHQT